MDLHIHATENLIPIILLAHLVITWLIIMSLTYNYFVILWLLVRWRWCGDMYRSIEVSWLVSYSTHYRGELCQFHSQCIMRMLIGVNCDVDSSDYSQLFMLVNQCAVIWTSVIKGNICYRKSWSISQRPMIWIGQFE